MAAFEEDDSMKKRETLDALLEPVADLEKLMRQLGCPWMIIGGIAVSLLGKPRFTADVDIVVLIEDMDVERLIKSAGRFGFKPRLKDVYSFARQNRVVLLQHQKSRINVDMSLGILPFEQQAVKNSRPYKIGDVTFRLPRVEDLIILKAVANRPQDLLDIREIIKQNRTIDKRYVRKTVKEFSKILQMPEILKGLDAIF